MTAIRLFVTGGTFDKEYNELDGALYFQDTHIDKVLKRGKTKLDIEVTTLMMVDSLDIKEKDRESILENCLQAKEDKIVITHGTDTIVETAKILGQQVTEKTIVLTGAMIPYTFGSSDGLFNMGSALAFVQSLPHGVYIAMNGQYFPWDNVKKNKEKGAFEKLHNSEKFQAKS